jgi:HEAT repeat protein
MRLLFSFVLLVAALSSSSVAQAKRIDKMTDDAVRDALENDKDPERRAQAATVLGDRGVQSATVRLGARCGMDPEVAVCIAAVDALATLGSPGALDQAREVLIRDRVQPLGRRRALAVLVEKDPELVLKELPDLLARYRPMDPVLLTELLVATRLLEAGQLADAMVFIASDDQLPLTPRVAALDAAEYFAPPRLHEAHMALLKARDSKVRVRCAEGLGGPSLPATQIIPLLQEVVRKDPEGYVRTAALSALSHYAHPGLLPLLQERVVAERHPVGQTATLNLAVALADETSVPSLAKLIESNRTLKNDELLLVVRKLAHLGDQSVIPVIYAVEQRFQGTPFAEDCRLAAEALNADNMVRQNLLRLVPFESPVELREWDPEEPDPVFDPLTVKRTPKGLRYL